MHNINILIFIFQMNLIFINIIPTKIFRTRFSLQMKKGGLVRIHDSILMEESKYKCLLISDETTVEDVIR